MGWDPGMDEAMTLGIKSHFFTPFVAKKSILTKLTSIFYNINKKEE